MPRSKKNATRKRKLVRKIAAKPKDNTRKKTALTKVAKAKTPAQPHPKSVGANRAEGIRLFKLAGRPTKQQFVIVYGEAGPRMTWLQRAEAGVPAENFQAALAAKQRGS